MGEEQRSEGEFSSLGSKGLKGLQTKVEMRFVTLLTGSKLPRPLTIDSRIYPYDQRRQIFPEIKIFIRIIAKPYSPEIPDSVSQALIGMIFPAIPVATYRGFFTKLFRKIRDEYTFQKFFDVNVVADLSIELNDKTGFIVDVFIAIIMLSKKDPKAADWCRKNFQGSWLFFNPESCEIVII